MNTKIIVTSLILFFSLNLFSQSESSIDYEQRKMELIQTMDKAENDKSFANVLQGTGAAFSVLGGLVCLSMDQFGGGAILFLSGCLTSICIGTLISDDANKKYKKALDELSTLQNGNPRKQEKLSIGLINSNNGMGIKMTF